MDDPITSTFIFHKNGQLFNLNNSQDEWRFTVDRRFIGGSNDGFETGDIYVTLKRRADNSSQPIKALFMSYFLVEEKIFYPGVRVKLTLASSGTCLFAARIIYPSDQQVLTRMEMKGLFVPGDGCNLTTDTFDVSTYDNNYHLRAFSRQMVHIFYNDRQVFCKTMDFMCDANRMSPITPHDISPYNRYIHIVYFKTISSSSTGSMIDSKQARHLPTDAPKRDKPPSSSKHLCSICLEREANQLLIPCNHICYCENCIKKSRITECPICRRRVDCRERVFFPL